MRTARSPHRDGPIRLMAIAIACSAFGLALPGSSPSAHAADPKPGASFQAGAATSNISPWLGMSINGNMHDGKATHIHDELHARALVLDDGKTKLAIIVCDSCMIPREVITDAKRLIRERSKLEPDHVLISATHAHSCPTAGSVFQSDPDPEYLKFLAVRIADAVQRAVNNLEPAKIGWGAGKNAEQVFNRRWKMKPGTIPADPFGKTTDRVRMNPGIANPNLVEPAGPIDPEVPIVSVRSAQGRPIALLANYSLHYVGGVGAGHASADYYGAFADRTKDLLEGDRLDPPFVAMMSNGTSGDINNINFREAHPPAPPYGRINLVANELATEAVRVAQALEYHDDLTLDARAADLKLGVRQPNPEELAAAEATLASAKKGADLNTVPELYARESILLSKYPKQVDVNVQALRIGGLVIVAIPCEVFVEIGLKLKAESPIKPAFTIELANGYNGYLPTKEQHELGGYETWRARSSYLEVDAASKITTKALDLLQELEKAR
ncbi:Neutral/alkaline non-lysosomal ceramidase [Singulisphaera acidiphila DSM 18658]|uniref:Neutral/alkaline non-lysosomal ceramidase n=2 Tax=Singulisphaera acidiphila TaxID=466153 RepID=L0DEN5_SINAD|nr:Neutral/alkaline non-lysosomal ceramidase [Singulisphaera acidiphila DSM 18658]